MKTIGLLGGMSWESTELYYRWINEETRNQCGGLHSAPIAMVSVDFEEIEKLQHAGNWEQAGAVLADRARRIESAGADFLLICTNTMHKVADQVEDAITIPLLHLADATASRIKQAGMDTVGLLGTTFTMEQDFYRGRLEAQGIEVLVPAKPDREIVHRIIYEELCRGIVDPASRETVLSIVDALGSEGAEAVILGCTEITTLINDEHTDLRLYDTTRLHAEAAVDWALAS